MRIYFISSISILLLFIHESSFGQVGIGTTNPNSSAALDVAHTSKGVLIPRMTMVQRQSISNPAEGLMVYQIDSTKGFWHYTGSAWDVVGLKPEVRYNSYSRTVNGTTDYTLDSLTLLPGHTAELDYYLSVYQNSGGSRTASFEVTNLTGDRYTSTSAQQVSETVSSVQTSASGSFILKNMSTGLKKYMIIVKSSNYSSTVSHSAEWRFIIRVF